MRRRKFIKTASGLLVPSLMSCVVRGSVPIPLGFWKPASSSATTCTDAAAIAARDNWVAGVQGVGSDVTIPGTQLAVCAFIAGLMSDGIWSKIFRINIYAGDGLNALKAPLVGGGSQNTQDILNNFVAGDYSQSIGLTGNGSTKYVTTGALTNDAPMSDNDVHLSVYCRTTDGGTTVNIGTTGPSTTSTYLLQISLTSYFVCNTNPSGLVSAVDATNTGHYIGSRIASNDVKLYKNGSVLASGTGVAGAMSNLRHFVHAGNENGAANYFTARTIEMYSMGTGLTATEAANFTARYATLRTALGR